MRQILVSVAIALLALACAACGGSVSMSRPSSATTALPQIELKGDADSDSDKYGTEPDNENEMLGHPAGAASMRAVTMLVRRYYAAAAAAGGADACRLLYLPFAESVAEDYGSRPASSGVRGDSCAAVLSALFRRSHRSLSVESATLRVAAVRVERNRGAVQLRFAGGRPVRYVLVHRERGAWKMDALFDTARLPLVE
jgi:hypothetical protein